MTRDQIKEAQELAKDIQRLRDWKDMYGSFSDQPEVLTGMPLACPFDTPNAADAKPSKRDEEIRHYIPKIKIIQAGELREL